MARRSFLLSLLLFAASPASAQTGPGARVGQGDVRVPASLAREAAAGARFVLASDGRVERGWRLGLASEGRSPEARAARFLADHRASLALTSGLPLRVAHVVRAHGFTIVRFAQEAFGGDVLGASVVVRFGPEGRIDYVAAEGADARLATAGRRIDRASAERIALARVGASRVLDAAAAALAIDGALVPVWRVDVAGARLHERWRVIVDARDGAVRLARTRLSHALGRVFLDNPYTDEDMTSDVELPFLTSREHLTGRYFRVRDCNAGDRGCDPMPFATADADGNFLYEPEEPSFSDPFAEVHGYYHLNRVASYFRDTHGFTWTCASSTVMQAYVNYASRADTPYENAAYAPGAGGECGFIFFGQGAELDFAYDADVIYHETTHSVVEGVAGIGPFVLDRLGVSYEPGAVNEGTADYFAATLQGDPALAEYFMSAGTPEDGALRRLDNALACPDDLTGEAHYDGRVWSGLGWDVREALGPARADALMFATLSSLGAAPSLAEAGDALLATAAAMGSAGALDDAEVREVEGAVAARGLPMCRRVVSLEGGAARMGYSGDPNLTGALGGSIAPVHYRLEVPADASSLRVTVTPSMGHGRYHLYARTGAPVRAAPGRRPPLIASADWALDREGAVVIDRASDPPLPRCDTLYLAIVTEDLARAGASLFTITAELERSGQDASCEDASDAGLQGDAGADAGPSLRPAGGGCSCRAGSDERGAPGALSIALLFALAWRLRGGHRGATSFDGSERWPRCASTRPEHAPFASRSRSSSSARACATTRST